MWSQRPVDRTGTTAGIARKYAANNIQPTVNLTGHFGAVASAGGSTMLFLDAHVSGFDGLGFHALWKNIVRGDR